MKFTSKLTLVALSMSLTTLGGNITANAANNNVASISNEASLPAYEQQIGFQRKVVLEETKALDEAYKTRNNQVHIGKDLRDLLAYGVSSGYLGYRFMNKTNNLETLRNYLAAKKVPKDLIPEREMTAGTPLDAEAATLAASEEANASRAALYRAIGTGTVRAAELTGAVVLGIFLVNDISDTGKDLYVRFTDTDAIREHRARLKDALNNLDSADKNLQAAILAESSQQ